MQSKQNIHSSFMQLSLINDGATMTLKILRGLDQCWTEFPLPKLTFFNFLYLFLKFIFLKLDLTQNFPFKKKKWRNK